MSENPVHNKSGPVHLTTVFENRDENEYNHHHDYEIEFEVEDYDQGLQAFKKIIQPYHLEYKQNCLSKIKRMLETLKNE